MPDQPDPVLVDNLGDFKDELEGGDYNHIVLFRWSQQLRVPFPFEQDRL